MAEFAAGTDSREFRLCVIVIFHLRLALSMIGSKSPLQKRSVSLFYKLKRTWGAGEQLWRVHQGGKSRARSPGIENPDPVSDDLITAA